MASLSPFRPSPSPTTNAFIRATTSARRGLNYFLIRSFQAGLTGPGHNAPALLTHAERQHTLTPLPPLLLSRRPPPPRLAPRKTVPQEELRVRDCEAYSTQTRGSCLDRSIGVQPARILPTGIRTCFCRCHS